MTWKLFLDDIRKPWDVFKDYANWSSEEMMYQAINYNEAVTLIELKGSCPSFISFDHDLAFDHYAPTNELYVPKSQEKTGYDFAKWLVLRDLEEHGKFIPPDFKYNVHSANPVGAKNIRDYLDSYLQYKKEETTHL